MRNIRESFIEKSGILYVHGADKIFTCWKKRWIHLRDQQLTIYKDSRCTDLENTFNIRDYRVSVSNSITHKGHTFKLEGPNKCLTMYFSDDSRQSMTQWINTLRVSASILNEYLLEPKKPTMPVKSIDHRRFTNSEEEDENDDDDDDRNRWYYPRSSPPPIPPSVNNSVTHQALSATMGSWGFDVNRPTNGQTPSSFTSNNNHSDHHTITRTTKDYNERLVDISSPLQNVKLRTPTLTRHRDGNEFAAVDRLVLGPNRILQPNNYPSQMLPTNQSRSRSNDNITAPQSRINPKKHQAESELIAWQNRMLERDNQSPKIDNKRTKVNFNTSQSSNRQIPSSIRPISATSNMSDSQRFEHDHHESMIKSARVIKRYIELLYHLQSFYERMTDQLFNGNSFLRNNNLSSQSIFMNHCRKISEQLQKSKPTWERKLMDLQNLLKDISSFERSTLKSETIFLQRPSTLINLMQSLNAQKDLDDIHLSILTDIDRVLHEDKLAFQLQDELSTLLQHQSLLNDFTSLLQWNRQIYTPNEQNRVESVLPFLREQIATTDTYVSHVSQQLTELVTNLRALEKYILSYTNPIPLIDDGILPSQPVPSNRDRWRPYNETDVDAVETKEFRLEQFHRNNSPNHSNENLSKTRSASMPRYIDSEEPAHNINRDDLRISTKKVNTHLNTNNSNNNGTSTRIATVKSARRDNGIKPNSILKPYPHTHFSTDTEIFRPNKVDFQNDDQPLTANERIIRMKKKEEVRKMLTQQNIQDLNYQDINDGDIRSSYHHHHRRHGKGHEKVLNLQSVLAEEAKEKSRQVAAKRYLTKSYHQRSSHPDS